jgi:hypothetical protein
MPISLTAAVAGGFTFLSTSPTPGPGSGGLRPGLSADQVTPGFLGFAMTAFMVVAVVLLMVSMTRRIRRVRYRAQFSTAQQEASESGEDETEKPSDPKPM